jgi:hypothetical protein
MALSLDAAQRRLKDPALGWFMQETLQSRLFTAAFWLRRIDFAAAPRRSASGLDILPVTCYTSYAG